MADLRVLRGLLNKQKLLERDTWHVAKAMFQPGVKLQYTLTRREYYGKVVEVIGSPGNVRVRVENLATFKRRDIALSDITGLVQE